MSLFIYGNTSPTTYDWIDAGVYIIDTSQGEDTCDIILSNVINSALFFNSAVDWDGLLLEGVKFRVYKKPKLVCGWDFRDK